MVTFRRASAMVGAVLTVVGVSVGAVSAPALAAAVPSSRASSSETSTADSSTTTPLQVLTIGDSIMNGHGLAAGDSWPYLVGAADNWTVDNEGCDGAGVLTPGDPAKCDSDYAGIITAKASSNPDIVIFEGSSNDFGLSDAALRAETIADLTLLKAEFPAAQIVGLNTLWGSWAPASQLANIAQVDSEVKEAVTDVGGTYIDIGEPMYGHPELMQSDDVHPNAAGQAVLATTIQSAMAKVVDAANESRREAAETTARVQVLVDAGVVQ